MPSRVPLRQKLPWRLYSLFIAALFFSVMKAGLLHARPPSISPKAHQALSEAQALIQNSKWSEAEATLRRVVENFSREPHALAVAWQMRGYLLSQSGRAGVALQAFEKALELDVLDADNAQQVRYNTAQILMSLGRPADAVKRLDSWVAHAAAVSPEQRVQVGWIYLGAKNYAAAARHLEEAVRSSTATPPESWYQLLIAALQGAENYSTLKEWLPVVIGRFPREIRYWRQLSSVYLHLKEDRRAVATLSAAYHNGLLTESGDLLHLARLYLYVGVPHKAARVLQDALQKQQIAATAGHYELLADSWIRAQEIPRAVETLQKALQAGAGYETRLKLGRLHVQREEWSAALEHLQLAAQTPQERTRGEALLLLGMRAYYAGEAEAARNAFVQARSHSAARRQADDWLSFLDGHPPVPGP